MVGSCFIYKLGMLTGQRFQAELSPSFLWKFTEFRAETPPPCLWNSKLRHSPPPTSSEFQSKKPPSPSEFQDAARDMVCQIFLESPSNLFHLNNRVFLSRNYWLILALRKFNVLKTNICPRSEASRTNMLVLRTSNLQGATIRPIVLRHKHSIVFIFHH